MLRLFFTLNVIFCGAFELPRDLATRLPRGEYAKSISTATPDQLTDQFERRRSITFVGAGCEGVVFKDEAGSAWKFSLAFFLDPARAGPRWIRMREILPRLPGYHEIQQLLRDRAATGWPLKTEAITREVFGGLVWSAYNRPDDVVLPELIADDGLVYRARFIEGPSLETILDQDRQGTNKYAMSEVWKDLVRLQQINEQILNDTGFAVDLFNPSNVLVAGPPEHPRLIAVDYSLAFLQSDMRDWRVAGGQRLPETNTIADAVGAFPFPVTPTQIISSRLFNLSYPQALDYLSAFLGRDTGEREALVKALAAIKKWDNLKYPQVMNHQHIDEARAECARLLTQSSVRR